jgi:hypothetical protein
MIDIRKIWEYYGRSVMKFSPKSVVVLLVAAMVVFIVFGIASGGLYQSLRGVASKPAPEAQVKETTEGVEVESEEGKFSFKDAGLPDNFPEEFPVYEGAVVDGSWSTQGEEKEGMSVIWKVEAPIEKVADFYREALVDAGWQITGAFDQEKATTLTIGKQFYEGFIGVAQGGENVVISVTIGLPNDEL